jgi:hypothetical protein
MSLVYAEGFDRIKLGPITNGLGLVGKASDIGAYSTSNVLAIAELNSRRWIMSPTATYTTSEASAFYLKVQPGNELVPPVEAQRGVPTLPPIGNAKKLIIGWRMTTALRPWVSGTHHIASAPPTGKQFSLPSMVVYNDRPDLYFEIVHDVVTGAASLYIDGVVVSTLTDVPLSYWKINMACMVAKPGATQTGALAHITDIYVVYDDGIAPSSRLGSVNIRELAMDRQANADAGITIAEGVDVTTTELSSTVLGTTIKGDGVKETYLPKAVQSKLNSGPIYGIVSDLGRSHPGGNPANVETKLSTKTATSSFLDLPNVNMLTSVQSLIKGFATPASPKRVIEDIKVEVVARPR